MTPQDNLALPFMSLNNDWWATRSTEQGMLCTQGTHTAPTIRPVATVAYTTTTPVMTMVTGFDHTSEVAASAVTGRGGPQQGRVSPSSTVTLKGSDKYAGTSECGGSSSGASSSGSDNGAPHGSRFNLVGGVVEGVTMHGSGGDSSWATVKCPPRPTTKALEEGTPLSSIGDCLMLSMSENGGAASREGRGGGVGATAVAATAATTAGATAGATAAASQGNVHVQSASRVPHGIAFIGGGGNTSASTSESDSSHKGFSGMLAAEKHRSAVSTSMNG